MKTERIVFTIILLLCVATPGSAQERLIHGMVTTFDSIPLIGAKVRVKSTKEVVLTDTLGRFSARIAGQDKLKVTAQGFFSERLKVDKKVKLALVNLKLKPSPKATEYAIGYGYVKDERKLNALAQLSRNDVDFSQYSNMYDLIKGRFAGVSVQGNGDIVIRGANSINLSNSALIVVDGVVTDSSILQAISPSNVKSINIIKDGGSAIYGSRGANGVILIETLQGSD